MLAVCLKMRSLAETHVLIELACVPEERKGTDREQNYTKHENQPTLVRKNEPIPKATATKALKHFRSTRKFVEHRGAR